MALKADCLFCKIIKGEVPSQRVYEDEYVIGFKDINPAARIHYLFVPKYHTDSLCELEDYDTMSDMYRALVEVAEKEGLFPSGFRTVINTGKEGGQTVPHLHLHLIGGQQLNARMG